MWDIGAYFIGTFFGRHKLCPAISPKKTVEGLIGGIVVSVGSSVLGAYLYQVLALGDSAYVSLWQIALLALPLRPAVGSRRSVRLHHQAAERCQDFGHIMPGHGWIMDRFDSMMFVLPVLYILVQYVPPGLSFKTGHR